MAKILLIETATDICGAAIAVDGQVVATRDVVTTAHATVLNLLIEDCVRESGLSLAQLDAVAVSAGPGSYTSLRIGVSTAKGICYALEKPLIAVDTLRSLAWSSREWLKKNPQFVLGAEPVFWPMLDARRAEIVSALFGTDLALLRPSKTEILRNEMFENCHVLGSQNALQGASEGGVGASFSTPSRVLICSGNGIEKTRNVLNSKFIGFSEITNCHPAFLAVLAEESFQCADFQSLAYFEPVYMKPPNITAPAALKSP